MAHVGVGEFVRAVCATPGLPGVHTARNWAKADPLFCEALAAGPRRGRSGRGSAPSGG
ncbi:MAG TPA: hypothetical protein VFE10_06985 [Phenylobacterium sp.]|nr:hypothetical protein [Phenylobacterium sp.]